MNHRRPLAVSLLVSFGLVLPFSACAKHSGEAAPVDTPGRTPRFETRIEVATDSGSHADMAVADFDGDTWLDLAVISLTGELRVMHGANGTFTAGQPLQLGGDPIWIANADFDRDGDQDLVVVRTAANVTTVLWNNGLGTFSLGPDLPVGAEALAVVAADANDDTFLDVVVGRTIAPEVVVWLGNGSGTFTAGSSLALPGIGSTFNLEVGEVTRDNVADLVVCDPVGNRVLVFRGIGGPSDFDPTPIELMVAGEPKAVSIGDLNGDGFEEMVVSAYGGQQFTVVTSFPPTPGVTAWVGFSIPVAGPPTVSVIGDVTGDGANDLVACVEGRASVAVVPQLSNGTLGAPFQLDTTGLALRPFVGDVDRNGKNDLVVLSGLGDLVNVWVASQDGRLNGARNHDTGLTTATYVAGGDFDGDGTNEVAVGDNMGTRVAIMRGTAGPALEVLQTIELGRQLFNIESVDLDLDGRNDLVVPVLGGVKLLRNRSTPGAISFDVLPGVGGPVLPGGAQPFGVVAADLDRDGGFDLAIADFSGGNVTVLRSTVDPFVFRPQPVVVAVGGAPIDVVAADFTGDGILDLAVSRSGQSDIMVLRNDGNANFAQHLALPVGTAPNYLLTEDFDRDGRADLVVSNGHDESISILFGREQGFQTMGYAAGRTPTALLVKDLTDDGIPDVLVASLVSGDFRVLAGDGNGGFPEIYPFPGTLGATGALLQDMTGDQLPDLLIASQISSRLSLVVNVTR